MNIRVLAKYWRTILVVAEMTIRQQLMDGFILFTVLFQPIGRDSSMSHPAKMSLIFPTPCTVLPASRTSVR